MYRFVASVVFMFPGLLSFLRLVLFVSVVLNIEYYGGVKRVVFADDTRCLVCI